VIRDVSYVQESSLQNQRRFFPKEVEKSFDLLTMQTQQLQEQVNRSVRVPIFTEVNPGETERPLANASLVWNAAGTKIVNGPLWTEIEAAQAFSIAAALSASTAAAAAAAVASFSLPIGSMLKYPDISVPTNWLKTDGATVSRDTYAALFVKIGTLFGAGAAGSERLTNPSFTSNLSGWSALGMVWSAGSAVQSGTGGRFLVQTGVAPGAGVLTIVVGGLTAGTVLVFGNYASVSDNLLGLITTPGTYRFSWKSEYTIAAVLGSSTSGLSISEISLQSGGTFVLPTVPSEETDTIYIIKAV